MALEPNELPIVVSSRHRIFYNDHMCFNIAGYLGIEAIHGLALANKHVYERLSDRMLCSVVVDECFGSDGRNEMMSAALQMKCLAKIEERGIVDVLVNEIKSKLRAEDGLNCSHLTTGAPIAKWVDAAIKTETLVGVERMDVSGSILAPRGDIETDAQFAKIVRQHFNHRVQFYKRASAKIDSKGLSRIGRWLAVG